MENIQQQVSVSSPPLINPATIKSSGSTTTKALKRLSNYRLALGWVALIFWLASVLALR